MPSCAARKVAVEANAIIQPMMPINRIHSMRTSRAWKSWGSGKRCQSSGAIRQRFLRGSTERAVDLRRCPQRFGQRSLNCGKQPVVLIHKPESFAEWSTEFVGQSTRVCARSRERHRVSPSRDAYLLHRCRRDAEQCEHRVKLWRSACGIRTPIFILHDRESRARIQRARIAAVRPSQEVR